MLHADQYTFLIISVWEAFNP